MAARVVPAVQPVKAVPLAALAWKRTPAIFPKLWGTQSVSLPPLEEEATLPAVPQWAASVAQSPPMLGLALLAALQLKSRQQQSLIGCKQNAQLFRR